MSNPGFELEVNSRKLYGGQVEIDTNAQARGTENDAYNNQQISKALQTSADACAQRHMDLYRRDNG